MPIFYTNAFLKGNYVYCSGYKDGNKFHDKVWYNPTFYIEDSKSEEDFKSLSGKKLSSLNFSSIWECKEFISKYEHIENMKIYGLDRYEYAYLSDLYYKDEIFYDSSLIRIGYLDIETDHSLDIINVPKEITVITLEHSNIYYTFGTKQYKSVKDNEIYIKCSDEEELLQKFVNLFISLKLDILTGWNIKYFDVPYLINRIRYILGEDYANKLSPYKILRNYNIEVYGKEVTIVLPMGISIIDYMDVYRKFTLQIHGQLESYSLNYVSHFELKEKKLDYSEYTNLTTLYEKNYDLYVKYNIRDVELVKRIEEKNQFFELIYAMAYNDKVNYIDTLSSVMPWDIYIYNELRKENIIIPHKKVNIVNKSIAGGYVKEPLKGMHKYAVSFDLKSLYPHLIIKYNLSPETFIKKVDNKSIDIILKERFSDVIDICREYNISVAANYSFYKKNTVGFFPKLMKEQFELRTLYKKKMIEASKLYEETKDKKWEYEKSKYNNAQMAIKIKINSLYGCLSNQYFRYYSSEIAEAITLSGQLSIRWVSNKLNDYLNKRFKTNKDYVLATDTDSVILCLENYVKDEKNFIEELDKASSTELKEVIKRAYDELFEICNAKENCLEMKREIISDKVIFISKKRYIMNVWDKEGIRYSKPELKMMGIDAIRSTIPELCREKIKEIIPLIFIKTENEIIDFIENFKKEYFRSSIEDISFPRGVNGMEKYFDKEKIYGFKCPIHVRGALYYNKMIKEMQLMDRYDYIYDKDKLKFCYLKLPNSISSDVISFKGFIPREFGLNNSIDYDTMFEKSFIDPMKNILDAIGWETEKKSSISNSFITFEEIN